MAKYVFDHAQTDAVFVTPEQLYEKNGYGFITEKNRIRDEKLRIPEINSGFDTVYWYRNSCISGINADEMGCFAKWMVEQQVGDIPLTFAVDVPAEGNYLVTLTLRAVEDVDEAIVFLGRRRLAYRGNIEKGQNWCRSFVTNICPIIPRNHSEKMEDLTLDVTILGSGIRLVSIEVSPWEGKTLYIAGDSTVTDQSADYPYLPGRSYCGWGQMLSYFTGMQMAVSNHAHSGLTTESFRSEGHYQILLDRIQPGDICLFQFGHNDQKLMHLMAEGGYRDNLIVYIREIREKGAVPVLVTPLARNTWKGNDGSYNDLLDIYASSCKKIAEETKVPLLDLHEKSMEFVCKTGRDAAKRYFFPSDYTHSNDYGAYLFAEFVYKQMEQCGFVTEKSFAPWIPPEIVIEPVIPKELVGVENPEEEKLFEQLERPDDAITRVEALGFVITAMHFFPTNVYNDMFTDVVGHETYAGTVECAWQNGLIPEDMVENGRLVPMRPATGAEFLQMLMSGYKSRKPLPGQGDNLIKAAQELEIVPQDFSMEGQLSRRTAARICKKLHI